jgi:hypothetical protein
MAEGQMTSSTYLQIDALPGQVATLETAVNITIPATYQTKTDANKQLAALVELVDSGAKNRMPVASGSNTEQSDTWFSAPISLPAGDYVVFFEDFYSSNTDNPRKGRIAFLDGTASQNPTASFQYVDYDNTGHATNAAVEVTINNNDTATIRFYPAQTYAASTGDTVSFTNCMVCSKAAWEISHKFVPYCPSLSELYAMIQNSGNRVLMVSASAETTSSPETTEEETR